MFVDDTKGADFGSNGSDFRRHIDNQFIFVDESVVAAAITTSHTPGRSIQTWN
jgi:hypothetical protein